MLKITINIIILTALICFTGITTYATVLLQSNEVSYSNLLSIKNVENTKEALDELYDIADDSLLRIREINHYELGTPTNNSTMDYKELMREKNTNIFIKKVEKHILGAFIIKKNYIVIIGMILVIHHY